MNGFSNEFTRGLNKLKDEILGFKNEASIWAKPGGINNSPANLALHICGNLNFIIGAQIGKNGYIRQRDLEFTKTGLSRDDVIADIDETLKAITPILENFKTEDMDQPFTNNIFGEGLTTGTVLLITAHHLGYHLGQINYQRRLVEQ